MRAQKFVDEKRYFTLRRRTYENAERLASVMVLLGAVSPEKALSVPDIHTSLRGRGIDISRDRLYRMTKELPGFAPIHRDLTLTYYFEHDTMLQFTKDGANYPRDLYLLQRLSKDTNDDWQSELNAAEPLISEMERWLKAGENVPMEFVAKKAADDWTYDECRVFLAFALLRMRKEISK